MSNRKPQNNLKLYLAALSTGAALVLSAATCAGQAQNSVRYTKGQLEQVKSHTSRPIVYIEDDTPIVIDHRKKKEAATTYQINIPALSDAVSGGVVTLNPTSRNLPSAGFNSNIPAGGTGVNRNLPGVEQGHLGKQMAADAKAMKSTAVRQIGKPGSKPAIAAPQISTPSSPAAYSSYKTSGGSAGSNVKTTTDATGVIKKRDLLLK